MARGRIFQAAWAAFVIGIVAAVACGGSGVAGPSGPPFPFSGPSCSGADFNQGCWDCVQLDGGPGACFTSQCSAYFTCFCACGASDTTCQAGCKQAPACTTCLKAVIEYERMTCGSLCRGVGSDDAGDAGEGGGQSEAGEAEAQAPADAGADGG